MRPSVCKVRFIPGDTVTKIHAAGFLSTYGDVVHEVVDNKRKMMIVIVARAGVGKGDF
jgi:hypothetical protein